MILRFLGGGPATARYIAQALGLSLYEATNTLSSLRSAGVVVRSAERVREQTHRYRAGRLTSRWGLA